jgi:hypothetical protein
MLLGLLVSLALAVGPASMPTTQLDRTNDVNPAAPAKAPYGQIATDVVWDTIWKFNVEAGGVYSVGVTDVQDTLMWVSAGQTQLKIYRFRIDPTRVVIDSFPQTGGPSGWGIRDMAYDEATDYVYAGFDGGRYHVYNATTMVPAATYTVSGFSGTVRAMGYHPLEDSLWCGNFASNPMWKFSVTGTNGHQVKAAAQMGSCYGLAWDPLNSCFWMTNAGTSGASPMWKIDYPSYTVSDSFNPSGWDLGGGCEMWRDTFLLALEQATPDMVWCIRIGTPTTVGHDIALSSILAPATNVNPGTIAPKAQIRNLGTNGESGFPVTCWIDSGATRIYTQSVTYSGTIAPGATDSVAFPNWTTGPAGASYRVTMFANLAADERRANDTMAQTTSVTGAVFSDTIVVKRIAYETAPTIDGIIQPGEWNASIWYDVSDLAGRSGSVRPAGSSYLWALYDASANLVYIAGKIPPVSTRTAYDQLGPYMDEDRSGTWSTDSSEGNHWIIAFPPNDSVQYRALLSTVPAVWRQPGQCPGAISRSSTNGGQLQFEATIRIGAEKGDYNITPGEAVGFFLYTAQTGSVFYGWWPQTLLMANWANPAYYGYMLFDPNVAVEEPGTTPKFALYKSSTIVRDGADIRFFVGRQANVNLSLFDASGQLVRTLVDGSLTPGEQSVRWDRTAADGHRVANGTYFYRLTVDGEAVGGKAVVVN